MQHEAHSGKKNKLKNHDSVKDNSPHSHKRELNLPAAKSPNLNILQFDEEGSHDHLLCWQYKKGC